MKEARRNPPAGATPPAPPSAPPSPTIERTPNWFICPQCQLTKFGTANPQCFTTGEPQILECHGLASDGPPFGCGWKGTWDDVLKAWARREVLKEFAEETANGFDEHAELIRRDFRICESMGEISQAERYVLCAEQWEAAAKLLRKLAEIEIKRTKTPQHT